MERFVRPGTVFGTETNGHVCKRSITYRDARGTWHTIFVDHFPPHAFYIADGAGGQPDPCSEDAEPKHR